VAVPVAYPAATHVARPPVAAEYGHRVWLPVVAAPVQKRGVAVTYPGEWWAGDRELFPPGVWYYKWHHALDLGANQVPMLSARYPDGAAHLERVGYCGPVLFLNEPERGGQDDISVKAAVEWYADVVQRDCLRVIAGGVLWVWNTTGVDHSSGEWWMTAFHAELVRLGLPMPHGWHVHHYAFNRSPVTTVDAVAAWMDARGLTGELWLTEWPVCSGDAAVLREWLEELDAHPRLSRYSYFATRQYGFGFCGAFGLVDGGLTAVGREYVR
jgi:hypothetical protein